jgi:glycosyltransferase involved in cell wall biosynthesis
LSSPAFGFKSGTELVRIIIIADNASSAFGGEAFIPLNYFRLLRDRQLDVCLLVHARNKDELKQRFASDLGRLFFVEDTILHKVLFKLGRFLPRRLADSTTGLLIHLTTQLAQRRVLHRMAKDKIIDVVHVPIPVSPKIPSLSWKLKVAVVIGPLNGGMEYPSAFRQHQGLIARLTMSFGRWLSGLANYLVRGKREADIVLVANDRTRRALPPGIKGKIIDLVENGVDFSVWNKKAIHSEPRSAVRCIFVGRLVDWKALDIVIEAMHRLPKDLDVTFEIVGDGEMREDWRSLSDRLGLERKVVFSGWMSQRDCAARLEQSDVFVLPSLFECGGAVVLEAMAIGLPVIATAWGGPADYIDESCGILVEPESREALVAGFAKGMSDLARSRELRNRLGRAGSYRAREYFDWDRKIDEIIDLYALALQKSANRGG